MPVGTSDGDFYKDGMEYRVAFMGKKQMDDVREMASNEQSNDFQSRFLASNVPDTSGIAPEALRKAAGALKSTEGSQTPDNLPNIENVPHYDWIESMFKSGFNAFRLPGEVAQGKVDPLSNEGIDRTAELGLTAMGAPAAIVEKAGAGTLGSFAGVRAANVDKQALKLAQDMSEAGANPDLIHEATNFHLGADNRWKFEIPDQGTRINPEHLQMTETSKQANKPLNEGVFSLPRMPIPMEDKAPLLLKQLLDHPELYKAYPELANMPVKPLHPFLSIQGVKGMYDSAKKAIHMGFGTLSDLKSTMLHEIQHAIQDIEGFSTGASTSVFKSDRWKNLENEFNAYSKSVDDTALAHFNGDRSQAFEFKYQLEREKDLPDMEQRMQKDIDWANEHPSKNLSIRNASDRLIANQQDEINKVKAAVQKAKDLGLYEDLKKVRSGEEIKEAYNNLLWDHYRSVKGEVEARNVQKRLDWTPEMRKLQSPTTSEDYPRKDQRWSPWDPESLKDLPVASRQSMSKDVINFRRAANDNDAKTQEMINKYREKYWPIMKELDQKEGMSLEEWVKKFKEDLPKYDE